MRRLVVCLPVLVVLVGCWEHRESSLFESDGSQSSLAGVASSGGQSGGGAGSSAGSDVSGGSYPVEMGGTAGYPLGGGGNASQGGSSASGGGGSASGGGGSASLGGGGAGGAGTPPTPASCDEIEGAVTNESNGHCYRVSLDEVDFATARDACEAAGGHLVTISSEEENEFVHELLPKAHWLGATDHRSNTTKGVGEYVWVNDEPWVFSAWQDGQPNAYETACPTEAEGKSCYEHCGYQSDQGDWIDRSCWHTIPSVCEWELESDAE